MSPAQGWILHVDLDQFLAAVEVRRRPELHGLPVVVGGDGDPTRLRQVVATASYEARVFGVRSGMPMSAALRRCPQAVFLATDHPAYDAASAEVMSTLRTFPVVVQVLGWDEAFLGYAGSDPDRLAAGIRARILADTGLSCCVGVGDTKQRAKLATGFAKPIRIENGFSAPLGVARLTEATWFPVMGPRPVSALWGVGPRMTANLGKLGLHTVADLAAADESLLSARFGPRMGPWYQQLAHGGDHSAVSDEEWVRRGLSHERTYEVDLRGRAEIEHEVTLLARAVVAEVVAQQRIIARVAVKLRTASFFTATRIRTLPEPTTSDQPVVEAAVALLDRFDLERPVRLLGVRVELAPP
ncbi:MAG: DNA polymerase IV [Geodermatophilaceae bacterium]|nr:DNA polymerase IV [Geodermatophilaceae bacterium]